ncbi:hypothetical protein WN943_000653 [Citrus x changshan-huyou]
MEHNGPFPRSTSSSLSVALFVPRLMECGELSKRSVSTGSSELDKRESSVS